VSADAKLWTDAEGRWRCVCDGECEPGTHDKDAAAYDLASVIQGVETCLGGRLRWEFREYPDGQVGLVGYVS
jgi:hypothetical protein